MIKKFLAVALAIVLAFGLVACGSSKKKDEKTTKKASSNETTTEVEKKFSLDDKEIEVGYGTIKLAKLSDVVVYEDDVKVTKDAYKSAVDQIMSTYTKTKTVKKGTVKKDSVVTIDFAGKIKVKGKKIAFDGGTAQDTSINIESDAGNYIDGFVSSIVGHKVGDKFTKKLKFPKTYEQTTKVNGKDVKLAGKDVWFTYTVKSMEVSKTPELTDEFIKKNLSSDYGDAKTVAEFKTYEMDQLRKNNIMNATWSDFIDSCEVVSYDEDAKKELIEKYNEQGKATAEQYSASFEDYLEACSMSQEEWDEQARNSVESQMKMFMAIEALAKLDGYELSDDTYNSEIKKIAEQNSVSSEEVESYYEGNYGKGYIKTMLLSDKSSMKYYCDNITIKKGKKPVETTVEPTTVKEEKKAEEATKEDK